MINLSLSSLVGTSLPGATSSISSRSNVFIEVDGSPHREHVDDQARDAWLRAQGFTVLRFSSHEVVTDRPTVLAAIEQAIRSTKQVPPP